MTSRNGPGGGAAGAGTVPAGIRPRAVAGPPKGAVRNAPAAGRAEGFDTCSCTGGSASFTSASAGFPGRKVNW